MDRKFFEAMIRFAKEQGDDYSMGYQRGLRRAFHGDSLFVQGGHEKWLCLDDERGEGYRDGFSGKNHKDSHGLTGRPSNAKKDNPKQGAVQLRVDMDKKSAWVRYARSNGMSLSKFLELAADSFLEKQ
jgi:hypothetical protein